MQIGVLAVQGAFAEHLDILRQIGVEAVPVRLPDDLDGVSGLILPGGESTTMRKLIDRWGLREPILDLARSGAPMLRHVRRHDPPLAARSLDGDEPVLPLLDITVKRNAFGRQLDSFEAELDVPVLGDAPVHGVFIRRPSSSVSARTSTCWRPARRRPRRGGPRGQRHRHRVPSRAGRRDPLPPARGDDGRRLRRARRGRRSATASDPTRGDDRPVDERRTGGSARPA